MRKSHYILIVTCRLFLKEGLDKNQYCILNSLIEQPVNIAIRGSTILLQSKVCNCIVANIKYTLIYNDSILIIKINIL